MRSIMEVGCSGSGPALLLMFTIAIGAELTRNADTAIDTAVGEAMENIEKKPSVKKGSSTTTFVSLHSELNSILI